MPLYEKAKADVTRTITRVMKQHHDLLDDLGVKVEALMVYASQPGQPALPVRGHAAAAKIRVLPLRDRAKGLADAELLIDGDRWEDWPDATRDALIDHELTHLEPAVDRHGVPKRDDLDRPRLKIRPHDIELGVFEEVIARHRTASIDCQRVEDAARRVQRLFSFMDDPPEKPKSKKSRKKPAAEEFAAPAPADDSWREEPLSVLHLSHPATVALTAAEILDLGTLHDRWSAGPATWYREIGGLTPAIAAAVADKLLSYLEERST